jgi:hypothetical protein
MNELEVGRWASELIRLRKLDSVLQSEFPSLADLYDFAIAESRRLIESAFTEED